MNCQVLKGQMNVSFRKADSLLFSSWCGTDSSILKLEKTGRSQQAAKDCKNVLLLHLY